MLAAGRSAGQDMKNENIQVVDAYLKALGSRDLSLVPLADDMYFEDPVAGKHHGAENFRAFLSGFLASINEVRLIRHIADGEYVATHFEVDGVFGVIPIIEIFKIEDGKITEAIGYFDPRPILG